MLLPPTPPTPPPQPDAIISLSTLQQGKGTDCGMQKSLKEIGGFWGGSGGVLGGKRDWEGEGLGGRYSVVLGHNISAIKVPEVSMV